MTFFLDENFPKAAHALPKAEGHEVIDIRGTDREGSADDDLFLLAQGSRAAFLTTDKDFFHTVPHLYPHHHGVIVIALRQPDRKSIMAKLSWLLAHIPMKSVFGRVFLLMDSAYVMYPPLGS